MYNIKIFPSKQIRSTLNEMGQKWTFSVQDVVKILTDNLDVKHNIKKMLSRDELLKSYWGTICTLVEIETKDSYRSNVQTADIKGLLKNINYK